MTAQEQTHEYDDHHWLRRCRRCGRSIWLDRDHIADGTGHYHAECYYALCGAPRHDRRQHADHRSADRA